MSIGKTVVNSIRRSGFRATAAQAVPFLRYVTQHWYPARVYRHDEAAEGFDARHGTDTTEIVEPWNLSSIASHPLVRDNEITVYQATAASVLRSMLNRISLPWEEFAFIDLGSGKGRALLVASDFPFRKIVGVEFAAELHATAQDNVARYGPPEQRCREFELLQMDAARYCFPDEKLLVFLANPFAGTQVLPRVLHNLAASLLAVPREVYVLYANPLKRVALDELMAVAGLTKVRTEREPMRRSADGWWSLYASRTAVHEADSA